MKISGKYKFRFYIVLFLILLIAFSYTVFYTYRLAKQKRTVATNYISLRQLDVLIAELKETEVSFQQLAHPETANITLRHQFQAVDSLLMTMGIPTLQSYMSKLLLLDIQTKWKEVQMDFLSGQKNSQNGRQNNLNIS